MTKRLDLDSQARLKELELKHQSIETNKKRVEDFANSYSSKLADLNNAFTEFIEIHKEIYDQSRIMDRYAEYSDTTVYGEGVIKGKYTFALELGRKAHEISNFSLKRAGEELRRKIDLELIGIMILSDHANEIRHMLRALGDRTIYLTSEEIYQKYGPIVGGWGSHNIQRTPETIRWDMERYKRACISMQEVWDTLQGLLSEVREVTNTIHNYLEAEVKTGPTPIESESTEKNEGVKPS